MALFLFSAWFGIIALRWSSSQAEILDKLASYKRQLDLLRTPLPSEERSSEVALGTVSIPSRIYDRTGVVIGEFYHERRKLVSMENIPKTVIDALIASEDRKFYEHDGINISAIFRAFLANLSQMKFAQGGSTLTQQLAKILFTSAEKTIERKVFEMFCAREIEQRYVKDEILEMYLNLVYMGHGNYGIESAAQYYFNKPTNALKPAESALIIGILPNPNIFSPVSNLSTSLVRQRLVLKAMVEMGKLKDAEVENQIREFQKNWKVTGKGENLQSMIGEFPDRAWRRNLAPFFLDFIRQELSKSFSNEIITRGGLQIYTTLDYKKQKIAENSLTAGVEAQKKHYEALLNAARKRKNKSQIESYTRALGDLNGAFISLEPKTGYVTVMIGGHEFSAKNQYNRAVLAKRQIGSLMKPFVYYLGLTQKRITAASRIEDTPIKIGKFDFKNYDHKYLGTMSIRSALKMSRNTTAIRVLQMTSPDELRRMISESLDLPYNEVSERVPREAGIALGTSSFSPFEVAKIYATLVNDGVRVDARYLLRVEDSQGRILWEAEPPAEVSVLDPIASEILISMLKGIFEENGTASWVGRLRDKDSSYLPFEIAGKTGTTSDYNDAWFTGLTSDEVSVIWIGSDSNVSLGSGRSGGALCAPVWINFIRATRKENPPGPFLDIENPDGIVKESFCDSTGGVPRGEKSCPDLVKDELFFEGTEPKTFDSRPAKENNDPFE